MAAINYSNILAFTLKEEGDWPDSSSNPTIRGITLRMFQTFYKNTVPFHLKCIEDSQIDIIYRRMYWYTVNGRKLPAGVDLMVFDFGVNAGPERSVRLLQQVLGVDVDGVVGYKTLKMARKKSQSSLIAALGVKQKTHYKSLNTFPIHGAGWLARTDRRVAAALKMIEPIKVEGVYI